MSKLLYISTNEIWGGSEELWVRSAKKIKHKGYKVFVAVRYSHAALEFFGENLFNYNVPIRYSYKERVLNKLRIKKLKARNPLYEFISHVKAELIIISQGNNLQAIDVMRYCGDNNLKFFTITQLVPEVNFLFLNTNNIPMSQQAYHYSKKNFFVSKKDLSFNNFMLCTDLPNATTIHNPCKVYDSRHVQYPPTNVYKVALVGRVHFFHKGYDLLLQALNCEKWQNRNVQFNIYGTGPHSDLLKCNISRLHVKNVFLKQHAEDIQKIWEENHLLCMPSRMEGTSLALLEAMYFGRAAVVTNVGDISDLVTDGINGFIADGATIESINETLERAWAKREEWESMGAISHKIIKEKYNVPAEDIFNDEIQLILNG